MATLNLGCGVNPIKGAINHDISKHDEWVDVAWDLDVLPWPWPDESFDKVIAIDVMEHVSSDIPSWLDELWRILKPGGKAHLHLPAWDFEYSYRDPTHKRVFHRESFYYWQPGHHLHENYGRFYKGLAGPKLKWNSEMPFVREVVDVSGYWWEVEHAEYDFPERPQPYKGDLGFILRKLV